MGAILGVLGAKHPYIFIPYISYPKGIRPCVKPRLLTYCAPKSAAAFEFNVEKPDFGGKFLGVKYPYICGLCMSYPQRIGLYAKPRLLTYCAPKSAVAFSKNLLDTLSVTYDLEK